MTLWILACLSGCAKPDAADSASTRYNWPTEQTTLDSGQSTTDPPGSVNSDWPVIYTFFGVNVGGLFYVDGSGEPYLLSPSRPSGSVQAYSRPPGVWSVVVFDVAAEACVVSETRDLELGDTYSWEVWTFPGVYDSVALACSSP